VSIIDLLSIHQFVRAFTSAFIRARRGRGKQADFSLNRLTKTRYYIKA